MAKRWSLNSLKFLLVAGIFVYLYKAGQFDVAKLTKVFDNPGFFVSALFLILLGTVLAVERWRLLLKIQNIQISYWRATQLTFIGLFFSIVIPGAVSGDLVKAYYLAKGQSQKTAPVMSILFDRMLGLYTIIIIAAGTILFGFIKEAMSAQTGLLSQPYAMPLVLFVLGLFGGLTVLVVVFMNKRIGGAWVEKLIAKMPLSAIVGRIHYAIRQHGSNPGLTFKALIMSIVAQMPGYAGMWCLASILCTHTLALGDFLIALPICLLINSIPLAPAGLGVGEAGFRTVLLLIGFQSGAELAALYHSAVFILAIGVGGLIYLFSDVSVSQLKAKESES
jgi:glycosyltransferase 2 family protein